MHSPTDPPAPATQPKPEYPQEMQLLDDERLGPPDPESMAASYRALRKGREENKDEPGAADFYYGEMEMRRQRPGAGADRGRSGEGKPFGRPVDAAERGILWVYWLVSGYGLRASRALTALALTVILFGFAFNAWGFRPDQGYGRAFLFSLESTSSLFRSPETNTFALTGGGELMEVILRLLGPLFLGLALLSVRGRVKR